MITIKSNIEYLTQYNLWRRDNTGEIKMPNPTELGLHIEYAIETLKMIDQLKDDAWDESRIENIGRNGATGSHYE